MITTTHEAMYQVESRRNCIGLIKGNRNCLTEEDLMQGGIKYQFAVKTKKKEARANEEVWKE